MLRKLQLKFVAMSMALVTAVLAVVFLSIFLSTQRSVEELSRSFLHQVAQESGRGSFTRPGLAQRPDGELLLPYFTVEIWGSRAYVTGGTYDDLEDTEALEEILNACVKQPEGEGVLEGYGLRYLR